MGVTAIVPIEPGEEGKTAVQDILETIAEFSRRAGFDENFDVVTATCVSTGLRDEKIRIDISLQIPPEEIDEEPDYEIVEVILQQGMMTGGHIAWEIRPISYNPPKYPFWGGNEEGDKRLIWDVCVDVMMCALAHLYSYRAEAFSEAASENKAEAVALRAKARKAKSKITDKSLFS